MRGVSTVAWRGFTNRKARYALTAVGIVLGVANVFGVLVVNASTTRAVEQRTKNLAAAGDVAISPVDPDRPFDRSIIATVKKTKGVERVNSYGENLALRLPVRAEGGGPLVGPVFLLPIDSGVLHPGPSERTLRGRWFRPGRAEAVLSVSAAKALHKNLGDTVAPAIARRTRGTPPARVRTKMTRPAGPFTVVGIVADPDYSRNDPAYGSYTSLEYIWTISNPRTVEQINVYLDDSTSVDAFLNEQRPRFPQAHVDPISVPTEFRRFIGVLQGAMSGAAAIAVFVGAFLIYLTFSMAVVERTRMLGTLHALGATARQVRRLVILEAITVGVLATIAGLVCGYGLAAVLAPLASRVARIAIVHMVVTPGALIGAVAVGLIATLAGCIVPAVRAGRLTPVESIRGPHTTAAKASRAWIAGVVLLAIGLVIALVTHGIEAPSITSQTATLAILLGSVLVLPPIVGPISRIAHRWAKRRTGGLAEVAVMHVVRERNQSAFTLGLVMVVLAMMLSLAAAAASAGKAVDRWVDLRFGASLMAYRPMIDTKTMDAVRRVRGVSELTGVRFEEIRMTSPKPRRANLVVIDDTFFDVAGFPWLDGSDRMARSALRSGKNVIVPGEMARTMNVRRGSFIRLVTRHGREAFRVAGVYSAFGQGEEIGIVMGADTWRASIASGPAYANVMYINFTPDAPFGPTRGAIDQTLAKIVGTNNPEAAFGPRGGVGRSGFYFVSAAQVKDNARRDVRSYFALFNVVLLVAVVVGLLGLANTMSTSVVRRFREIGIVQAVGAEPRHVRRMIAGETALLVAVAFVLSLVLGTVLSQLIVAGIAAFVGNSIAFVFPWRWVPALAALAAVIAVVSAAAPARRAARLTPVEALRYE